MLTRHRVRQVRRQEPGPSVADALVAALLVVLATAVGALMAFELAAELLRHYLAWCVR
jgi:hypothetical protein